MKKHTILLLSVVSGLLAVGCAGVTPSRARDQSGHDTLVGAWRGRVQFRTGPFAAVKDLEFMYVFNVGGTMTESSNYDASTPVPPAYGVWRAVGPGQFEAKYVFYQTKAPTAFDDIAKGNGWSPAGCGVLVEKIVLAPDGKSFKSTIQLQMFDAAGQPTGGSEVAEAQVSRMDF